MYIVEVGSLFSLGDLRHEKFQYKKTDSDHLYGFGF